MKNVVMILGLSAAPAMAVLSGETGHIHGRAPTATGALQAVFPDGSTVVTEGVRVDWSQIPGQFNLTSQDLMPEDLDGDTGLNIVTDTTQANLTWFRNGIPFTTSQLTSPFGKNFSENDTLRLEVSAPVTVRSATGLPATAEPVNHSAHYLLRGPITTPVLSVNTHIFTRDSDFPSTGFINAQFYVYMNGTSIATNSDYLWEVSEGWLSVNASGRITFERKPEDNESRTVNVKATNRNNGDIWAWTFTVGTWFTGYQTERLTWEQAGNFCYAQGQRLPESFELSRGSNTRRTGALYSEWGTMNGYPWSGNMPTIVNTWTVTPHGHGYILISLSSGTLYHSSDSPDSLGGVVCRDNN
ncbi:hypothetical protein [Lelliottia sp. WAP21]|uniref:hypothetical protein n=1 Tax=Lelliottia sp. WAP21 TaxID=2877426 RepID=UPI001E33835E|nr:hypothetical protein [Lelliottia sp. WAP21]